ncbi:MAG: hypothetical protein N3A69_16255 [Leptospiraceae bacterium]|nr:hypothetical protein [Leptospiraceae bacterium]
MHITQPKVQEYFNHFLQELLPFKLRAWLIFISTRLLFFIILLLVYYISARVFYLESQFRLQLTLLITILFYIVFFIPMQETLEILLKKKFLSEYLYDDALALEHAYKNFELKTLISNVFPDMIKVSGFKSGKMIIRKSKDAYEAYSYIEGKSKRIRTQSFTLSENFLTQLKNSKDILLLTKVSETNPIIYQKMLELKVECIVPFIYKNKLFGFIVSVKL